MNKKQAENNRYIDMLENIPNYTEELKGDQILVTCPQVIRGSLLECSFIIDEEDEAYLNKDEIEKGLHGMKIVIIRAMIDANPKLKREDLLKEKFPFIVINKTGFQLEMY